MTATTADSGSASEVREYPALHWGAVWAGWFVATGSAMLLYAFGLAIGFSAFNPNDAATVARGVSAGAIVWMILTWGASLWIGAMFGSWFDGGNDTEMGVVRGLTVWGLSVTLTGLLVTRGLTHLGVSTSAAASPTIDQAQLAPYVAAIMWTAFGSAVVSLITSVLGGWLGARHVHRVYHLRAYRPHLRS